MFSKDVVDTERFYSLPVEAQLLYFHLGMHADVQGFVEPMKIARLVGIKIEVLKSLIDKKFVIPFESGVVVITDWHINNTIRETHEAPTRHIKELNAIKLLDQGIYELQENYSSTTVELPHSIDEVRVDKSRLEESNNYGLASAKHLSPLRGQKEAQPSSFRSTRQRKIKPITDKDEEAEELLRFTNELWKKNYRKYATWHNNFRYWMKTYSLDEIKKAISLWEKHGFLWKDHTTGKDIDIDLELLFQTTNRSGSVDYIGKLLNRSVYK